MTVELKTAVSVAEMARMTGLSRARFYQLMGTAFPHPVYCVFTKRPIYVEEMQKVCLEVRRRNCGIDGRPILFYSRRAPTTVTTKTQKKPNNKINNHNQHDDLIDCLRLLGLNSVNSRQVATAVESLFPSGTDGVDDGQVLRSVFLFLKRQN